MTKTEQHSSFPGESGRYRAIFEQSLTANLILSPAGEILDSNAAACRIFGYDCETLKGKSLDFLFDENPVPVDPAGHSSRQGQIAGKTDDREKKVFSYQYSKFEADSGQSFGILQLIDVTEQNADTEYLRLMESVVKGANDAVLITTSDPLDSPHGPEIVFVNQAFTKMTGFDAEDVIGKTPRILQGSETQGGELDRLRKAINNNEQVEVELLNYKKNGEEFWVELSLSPVFDGDRCTHFIAIQRDITTKKNREYLKTLQTDVSMIFNRHKSLADSVDATLNVLINAGDFSIAEIWTVDDEKQMISLTGHQSKDNMADEFYNLSRNVQAFIKGEGLPGITWETGEIQFWRNLDKREDFARYKESQALGVKTAYCVPIYFDNKVIGVLLLGVLTDHPKKRYYTPLLKQFGEDLGSEIDRKQTEEQLNRIFSFSPDIICVAGIDGYFKKVNPAMSRLLGYSQDELLNQPISSFTHPDDRFKTEAEISALSRNEGDETFQNRYLTKSGEIIWLSWTTRMFYEEGKIYSIARDITEEKELRDLLKQANRLAKIGSWEVDFIKNEHYWSDITREIHEVDPDYQPNMAEAINFYKEGDSRNRIEKALEKAILQGVSFDIEVQIITAKKNERWIRAIGKPELVNGKVVRLFGSFQDIHQRKKAELKQQRLAKERERILESIGDAFFAVNQDWTVTYWNSMAENVLSMPREHVVGKNLWEVFQDAMDLEFYEQYHKAMRENVTVSFEEFYPTIEKWFDVSAYPSSDGLSVFFKDITGRKENEKELKELNKALKNQARELAKSNAELEQFAFVASHDLQEPLRMVTGFLSLLEKKYADLLDDKARKYIWFATDGAKRMRQIILDLLDFSRVGKVEAGYEKVDLNELLKGVLSLNRNLISDKKVKITVDDLPEVYASRSSIRQLFMNLINNAIKYHSRETTPSVKVTSEEEENRWILSVQDNGIGIHPQYAEKIFNIFQRLHGHDEYSGTGMGLAICKKIVEEHGGDIWVESEEGEGSTFYFTIPKIESP